jgi:pimeloyl-ACP methyl ester carboxylesterase
MAEVSNNGVRINYEATGQGRPLVLLHGWLSDHSLWSEAGFVDDLQQDHLVVAVDLRGHGESDKPHEPSAYRAEDFATDVLAVADAEGLDRFAVWGMSYGGWVAWMTAYRAPERVAAMISTGSWDPRPGSYEDWVPWDEGELEVLRQGGMPALVDLIEKDEEFRFSPRERAMLLRADPQAMLACQSSELLVEGIPTLEGFPVPTLLIAGGLEDPDGEAAITAGLLPNGESLLLPGLGHVAGCVASEATLPTARAFLDRWFV